MEEQKPMELIPPVTTPTAEPQTPATVTQPIAAISQPISATPQTPAATTPTVTPQTAAKPQSTEIKLVITLNSSGTALVGISRTGTDPLFFNVEGSTIPDVMKAMPGLLVQASRKWAVSAKYPKAPDLPGTTTATTTSTPARKPAPVTGTKKQPAMPGM